MLSIELPAETRRRLATLAQSRGVEEGDLARELLEASIEDIEDIQMAERRLQSEATALSSAEARAALGLDD